MDSLAHNAETELRSADTSAAQVGVGGTEAAGFATSGAFKAVWSSCDDAPKSAAETTAATEEDKSGRVSALRAGRRSRAKAEAMNLLADIELVPSCDSPAEMILAWAASMKGLTEAAMLPKAVAIAMPSA